LDFLIDEAFQLAKIFASIGKKIFDNFKIIYSIVIDALTFVIKERSYT
jgi:tetrahydromethanopterin S-methyltransferase subunit G